jgi:hypothetical protein
VEDSLVVADALKQHLELFGATVVGPAATTAEAREVIMAGRPDVALVDFHLRGENSYAERSARRHHTPKDGARIIGAR